MRDKKYTLCIYKEGAMRTKVVKWGNSLGLRIPKRFAEEVRVSDGTPVDLSLEDGQLVIRVAPPESIPLSDLLAGITDSNIHGAVETGDPVGGENW